MRNTLIPVALLPVALLVVALTAALWPAATSARIYKWVDDQGNVQYTQTPPPEGTEAQEVKIRSDTSAASAPSGQQEEAAEAAAPGSEAAAAEVDKLAMEQAEQKRQNCEIVKKNLALLEAGARVQTRDAEGNAVVLDDAAIKQQIKQNQEQVKIFCQ